MQSPLNGFQSKTHINWQNDTKCLSLYRVLVCSFLPCQKHPLQTFKTLLKPILQHLKVLHCTSHLRPSGWPQPPEPIKWTPAWSVSAWADWPWAWPAQAPHCLKLQPDESKINKCKQSWTQERGTSTRTSARYKMVIWYLWSFQTMERWKGNKSICWAQRKRLMARDLLPHATVYASSTENMMEHEQTQY